MDRNVLFVSGPRKSTITLKCLIRKDFSNDLLLDLQLSFSHKTVIHIIPEDKLIAPFK